MLTGDDGAGPLDELLAEVETRRTRVGGLVSAANKRQLGQVFTPREVAVRIAAQPDLERQTGTLTILDPGAGVGVLAAAMVARVLRERPDLPIAITAVEVDEALLEPLHATLAACRQAAASVGIELTYEVIAADFVSWATSCVLGSLDNPDEHRQFDIVIQNPPYGKVQRGSAVRRYLSMLGIDVPNVYAAFLALGSRLLTKGGQLVAITPRSFCNGTYFRSFRRELLREVGVERVAVFNERGTLFGDSLVLQETLIFSATRGATPDKVTISTARGYVDVPHERPIPYQDLVQPDDPEQFIRIPTDVDDDAINQIVSRLPATLSDLELQVSTGRVVDFRATEYLRSDPDNTTVPLIYPHHFRRGRISWPLEGARKPNAIVHASGSQKLLLPVGTYVLVKRLSSKEETRRVVSCVCRPEDVAAAAAVGFENHLNVFHWGNEGIDPCLAAGLSAWLSSSTLDLYFRQFSGHTQVNATDLRNMRYPDRATLISLGRAIDVEEWPDQDQIDELVQTYVLDEHAANTPGDDLKNTQPSIVTEARELLTELNFDAERSNERSALVLLALAQLRPGQPWKEATNPLLRTVEIMDFLRQHHGRDYKPNTRETIRRQTLHQFADAHLVVQNPDQPDRPINSPKWCYQLTDRALTVLKAYRTDGFGELLEKYLTELPGLQQLYAAEREMVRIPLKLPDGREANISPGGQNPLLKSMINDFCQLFTPGGEVLYVGDAGDKWKHVEKKTLEELGIVVDDHGKMPDLVVYLRDKNWLVLLEAVKSHGPVDAKRHGELQTLFAGSSAGLVFVTCFPTRTEMRKFLDKIAWETEVWCADAPTHMIHFDGERFLGPYTS
ncbi:BsuBI/PstI family type II restriction endonuclease [Actinophytocola sp. KF-1]